MARRQILKDELNTGDTIIVHWGEEVFSPVQYNSFRVGGHSITTTVRAGETGREAFARAMSMLSDAADAEFEARLKSFKRRLDTSKGR